ncbi:MAG: lipopolysaccharide assembly protein LapA domain-containing protein, partial [Beijerinckiaceae bacterium]
IILFAVANRSAVTVSLDPFSSGAPQIAYQVPLYAVVLLAMALGILAGGAATWLGQRPHRKAERTYRRESETLRAETERLKAVAAAALPAPRS